MTTLRQEPFSIMNRIQEDINDFFRTNGNRHLPRMYDDPMAGATLGTEWTPTMDINERENEFIIHADLAGVSPADIEIYMDGNMLVIKGERTLSRDDTQDRYRMKEIEHGIFERRFSLPGSVDPDRIEAASKNGILTINIGKRAAGQRKLVQIKS
jgi:HSP20 family protein